MDYADNILEIAYKNLIKGSINGKIRKKDAIKSMSRGFRLDKTLANITISELAKAGRVKRKRGFITLDER